MRMKALAWSVVGLSLLAMGCPTATGPAPTGRTKSPPLLEIEAALAKAKEHASEEKSDYEQRLRRELDQLDARWQDVNSRGPQTLAETRAKAQQLIEELRKTLLRMAGAGPAREQCEESLTRLSRQAEQLEREGRELLADAERKRDQARVAFARVKAAPADAWRDARGHVDQALADFQTALANAGERVGQ